MQPVWAYEYDHHRQKLIEHLKFSKGYNDHSQRHGSDRTATISQRHCILALPAWKEGNWNMAGQYWNKNKGRSEFVYSKKNGVTVTPSPIRQAGNEPPLMACSAPYIHSAIHLPLPPSHPYARTHTPPGGVHPPSPLPPPLPLSLSSNNIPSSDKSQHGISYSQNGGEHAVIRPLVAALLQQ